MDFRESEEAFLLEEDQQQQYVKNKDISHNIDARNKVNNIKTTVRS